MPGQVVPHADEEDEESVGDVFDRLQAEMGNDGYDPDAVEDGESEDEWLGGEMVEQGWTLMISLSRSPRSLSARSRWARWAGPRCSPAGRCT